MPKIDITRTELVWPGKYDEDGNLVPPRRVSLPFQVIERVNETRATREQRVAERQGHYGTLFDFWQSEEGQSTKPGNDWRNKLIWGDNLYVMGSLLEHYAGKVDLIYLDPPFATGVDFSIRTDIGEKEIIKEQSLIEEKAYRDTWGNGLDSYLEMISSRLWVMRELLSDKGSIFIHLDWHVNSLVRLVMDEIFGRDNLVNELIWHYRRWTGSAKNFLNMHDTIYFYSKSNNYVFNEQWIPYTERSSSYLTVL